MRPNKQEQRRLLEDVEAWARGRSARSVELEVTVANTAAVGLYESVGYDVARYRMRKALDVG